MTNNKTWLWVLGFACVTCPAWAGDAAPVAATPLSLWGDAVQPSDDVSDKSGYSVFNPVPQDQMRAFSTDRPGKTQSSTTVDAGHWQVESDFVNFTFDHYSPNNGTTRNYTVAAPIIKLGVTNWADIETGFAFYNSTYSKDRTTGIKTTGNGFGDITLASKMNVFGNDGGRDSLAVIPLVKIPTAAQNVGNGVTEFGFNVPYTYQLDSLWSVTVEPELGLLKNANNNGLHGDYNFIANFNRPVVIDTLTAAAEFSADYSSDRNITPRYTFDPSLQWLATPTLQFDICLYMGLNRAAPDYNPYMGVSYRY